eukprot:5216690-Alexandrium_andersonii.AAC.1
MTEGKHRFQVFPVPSSSVWQLPAASSSVQQCPAAAQQLPPEVWGVSQGLRPPEMRKHAGA